MSEPVNEQKTVSHLQQLKAHHAHFSLQRDQTQMNYQQLVGAILACEILIKEEEEKIKKQGIPSENKPEMATENQGAIGDGQNECETKEQVA